MSYVDSLCAAAGEYSCEKAFQSLGGLQTRERGGFIHRAIRWWRWFGWNRVAIKWPRIVK